MANPIPYDKYSGRAVGDLLIVARSIYDTFNGYYGIVIEFNTNWTAIEPLGNIHGLDPERIFLNEEETLRFEDHKYDYIGHLDKEELEFILYPIDKDPGQGVIKMPDMNI